MRATPLLLLFLGWLAASLPAAAQAPLGRLTARPAAVAADGDAPRGVRALAYPGRRPGLLYVPTGYRADRPAPLLLLLHGAGGAPRPLIDAAKRRAEAVGVILMAPASAGPTWDLVADGGFGADATAIDALLRELFARYAVDPARIGIAGFSDGGSAALSLGLGNGDLFAEVAAFAPGFVLPAQQIGSPRVSITHGRADAVLPVDVTGRAVAAGLRRAGYAVDYREHDGGHAVPPAALAAAIEKLARATGPDAAAPAGRLRLAPLRYPGWDRPGLEQLLWGGRPPTIARFADPVCARVTGAASTLAQQIEAQVRAAAQAAGVAAHGGACRANLVIRLAPDAAAPASWRHQLRGRGGQRRIARAVVTLDKRRAERLPPAAIGGFAALVGLADLKLPGAAPAGSLLALFERGDAPPSLTTLDADFLRRLYARPR